MTHHARRRYSVDPTAQALQQAREGGGLRWEAVVQDAPADSCAGQLETLLKAASEYACIHIMIAVARDGWPSIAHYRSVAEPDTLRCGQCVSPEGRAALAAPQEHVRCCDCCGAERVMAGVTSVQAGRRTVYAWLCADCAAERVPGSVVLEGAAP